MYLLSRPARHHDPKFKQRSTYSTGQYSGKPLVVWMCQTVVSKPLVLSTLLSRFCHGFQVYPERLELGTAMLSPARVMIWAQAHAR